jgi:hypothetical protein
MMMSAMTICRLLKDGSHVELCMSNAEYWRWNAEDRNWTLEHDGPIYRLPQAVLDELLAKGYIKRTKT